MDVNHQSVYNTFHQIKKTPSSPIKATNLTLTLWHYSTHKNILLSMLS